MLLALVLVLGVLFWFGHPPVLAWAVRKGMVALCRAERLDFDAGLIRTRLGSPFVLENITLRAAGAGPSKTSLEIARAEWEWNGLDAFFSKTGRLVSRLSITQVSGVWDGRTAAPGAEPSGGMPAVVRMSPAAMLRLLPLTLELERSSVEILGDAHRMLIRDLSVRFSEHEVSRLSLGGLLFQADSFTQSFGAVHAVTAWKKGTFYLSGLEPVPGVVAENLSIDLLGAGGPLASMQAGVFGGTVRADVRFAPGRGAWDVAVLASNVSLESVPPLLHLPGKAAGRLVEGRFTFRGRPERPADAEASLRLVAAGFLWNDRGWELLEIGASLIHRRLVVSNFDLRQKENHVNFNGEVSLSEGWSQIATSPFLLNVRADIQEVGALAGILGVPLSELGGRMSAAGSLSGRPDKVDGFLSLEASGLEFRSLPVSSIRLDAVFRQSEVEIGRCEVYSRKDTLQAKANIGLAAPHHYSAELDAKVADLAAYLVPFRAPGAGAVSAGSMVVKWQGDGSAKAHSGAFDMQLGNFVSRLTPAGLTGKFAGTYSPQNVYFSKMEMDNGRLHLGLRTTVAASGITVRDMELRAGESMLLEGAAFFPIDAFAFASGTDWRAAIDADREAYIRAVTPKDLNIQDLLRLAGQSFPLQGRLRLQLEAGGPPAQLHAEGTINARGLSMPAPAGAVIAESSLDAKFAARDGIAELEGAIQTKGLSPLTLKARSPFGLVRTDGGDWRWINPKGEFEAGLDFPRTDLAVFSPFLPVLPGLTGELTGRLELSETFAKPKFSGRIDLKNGGLAGSRWLPQVEKTDISVLFEAADARIEHGRGEAGGGKFELSGGARFSPSSSPSYDLRLRGEKILISREPGIRLRANADLHAVGDSSSGLVEGLVRLVDGRIDKRLVVDPVLVFLPEDPPEQARSLLEMPDFTGPLASWALDVRVDDGTPLILRGNLAQGEIIPSIRLTGTLGQPVPVGTVILRDVQAFLPFNTFLIPDGRIDFYPDRPWVPFLDVRGYTKLPGCEIEACAFGPASEGKLILRSEPPLPQESLVALLSSGALPGLMSRPGFDDLSAGQDRILRRLLEPADGLAGPLSTLLTTAPAPPDDLGLRAVFQDRVRLWDNLDPLHERDGFQIYCVGAGYLWRLE